MGRRRRRAGPVPAAPALGGLRGRRPLCRPGGPGGAASRRLRGLAAAGRTGGREVLSPDPPVADGRLLAPPLPGDDGRPAGRNLSGGRDSVRGGDELPGSAGCPGGAGRGKRPSAGGSPREGRPAGAAAAGEGAARLRLSVALRDPAGGTDGT